ncbi:MAG: hypothetical protein HY434_00665 [Candidatus Liptonbacteria bacterium]|nr:hypothetical protein [Parcubacteria group bacterium]MBI4087328.1 hypothetical protein [Candidatus Liptonbacteria bacterium]
MAEENEAPEVLVPHSCPNCGGSGFVLKTSCAKIAFVGHPQDGFPMYDGYEVLRGGHVIGFIDVCGDFRNDSGAPLTEEEGPIVQAMCKKVYEMPSEYGWLGVGESPTVPFYQRIGKKDIV